MMCNTFRFRILSVVSGLIILTTLTMWYLVRWQSIRTIENLQGEQAENLLSAVTSNVENQYKSILFFKQKKLEERKEELADIVNIAIGCLKEMHSKTLTGEMTPKQARKLSLDIIKMMRYDNGVGYFWINDTSKPFPKMIMHTTVPELNGKFLDNPKYNCAQGKRKNLFRAFVDVCEQTGSGYVDYLWPKPSPNGLLSEQPKLSYVRLFKPWGWIIGTGIYIDDIETAVKSRVNAVIKELKETATKLKINNDGYMALFDGKKNMLVHPLLCGCDAARLKNPDTGRFLLDEIKLSEQSDAPYFDYLWQDPKDSENVSWKRVYVRHFKPLNWYICISYYLDSINQPVQQLSMRLLYISVVFIIIALGLSYILSRSLAAPLKKLASAAETIDNEGLAATEIPITGSNETRELGLILGNALDTIRKKEKSLVESSEKLDIILDSIGDAVIATDIEGRIVKINRSGERLTEWTDSEAIGNIFTDRLQLLDPETEEPIENPISLVLKDGQAHNIEGQAILVTCTKTRRLVADSCAPILSHEGKLAGAVMALRDVTERSRLENELRQAQKMDSLGQLAGGVAHDFNNMLAGIMASAELLERKLPSDTPALHKFTHLITDTCAKAGELTEKLLAFSRKGKVMSTPVDLKKIIDDAVTILNHSLDKRIDLRTKINAEKTTVIGDPTQIQNMIINLGVNGGHAMPDGGILSISVKNIELNKTYCSQSLFDIFPGNYIEIRVQDNGQGIKPENITRIFEPFFTTKEQGKGTGLGLAAVYGSVKEHHGEITVRSELGEGTVFRVHLPVVEKYIKVNSKPDIDKIIHGSGCILVVDDEPIIRTVLEKSLKDLGYDVILASNGAEGLSCYIENKKNISLVILDMVMPIMNGSECFEKLKQINPDVKVIIASGFTNDASFATLKEHGACGFIRKPFRHADLSRIISETLN